MSIIVDNTNQTTTNKIQNLTDKLTEIFEYMAELQKKYTDNKVSTEIENYVKDLEVTKEELKALVKALDNLDFKEDGKIDANVITAKVASNEAEIKVTKENIESLKETIVNIKNSIQSLENTGVDLTPVYNDITAVKMT